MFCEREIHNQHNRVQRDPPKSNQQLLPETKSSNRKKKFSTHTFEFHQISEPKRRIYLFVVDFVPCIEKSDRKII